MAKINVLDSKTYNKIAAGEVVERPASVVKELVENCIDAKAKSVTIEIEDGGTTKIRITDDGVGIEREELPKTILAHATSKLLTIDDLTDIRTLGFRGEALASIASVSKIKITSKPVEQEDGAMLFAEGGANIVLEDTACPDGTEICVDDLFFNVPARQKFLKTVRSEENEITNIVFRLILGYPDVSFKYVVDGKTVYHSYGDGFEGAMLSVYGLNTVKGCFYIDTIKNGLHIYGYLGKHHFTKGNKTHQSLYVNGRYVINSTTSSAIMNAYSPYLMKRQYPFYVLKIDLPTEIVDVNVHPTKADVRFSNNQIIYGSLYSVVSNVLNGSAEALNIVKDESDALTVEEQLNQTLSNNVVQNNSKNLTDIDLILFDKASDNSTNFITEQIEIEEKKHVETSQKYNDIFEENKAYLQELENKKKRLLEIQKEVENKTVEVKQEVIETAPDLVYVGQVMNKYLILQDYNNVYFIDQHASHERILYDKLLEKVKNGSFAQQPLLIPYVITLTGIESDFLSKKLDYIRQFGIDIEEFGQNSFKISALPLELGEMNVDNFILDVVGDMSSLTDDKLPEYITDKLAQKACKSAIKAGQQLAKAEIDKLLELLKGNMALKCPHGRPVAVKITETEIDKWFKRIL